MGGIAGIVTRRDDALGALVSLCANGGALNGHARISYALNGELEAHRSGALSELFPPVQICPPRQRSDCEAAIIDMTGTAGQSAIFVGANKDARPLERGTAAARVALAGQPGNLRPLKRYMCAGGLARPNDNAADIVAALLGHNLSKLKEAEPALGATLDRLEGAVSFIALIEGVKDLFAASKFGGLVIAYEEDHALVWSDQRVSASLEASLMLHAGDVARLTPGCVTITDKDGMRIEKRPSTSTSMRRPAPLAPSGVA